MGDPGSKASDPERRASVRTTGRVSLQQDAPNALHLDLDLDDDYSLLAFGGMVADGFRPEPAAPAQVAYDNRVLSPEPAARPVSPESPRSSFESPSSPSPPSTPQPNRSSISKPPRGRDSFTLRHDGAMGHVGAAGPSMSRVSSASTESPYISNDTPYQGPTGPSHPYQMYSQGTRLARTTSVATASTTPTTRPESEYNGPRGPSHPYSMYPQNPVEEASPQPAVPAIPVGFMGGAADPYQRRIGPEGEEMAGIIGPDGHTEELPPYTRYPDELYARKIRDTEDQSQSRAVGGAVATTASASVASASMSPAPITTLANVPPVISGAGGLGLAARNPEFDSGSLNDASSPQSRHSSRSFTQESHHEINTAAATVSEKPHLNKYQRFARRKACGVVPYWSICMTASAILIVVIIVAAVIGSLLSHRHKPGNPSNATPTNFQDNVPTVTVTFDATPIPTPSDLPSLPQGTFGLPMNLNQAPDTCFNDTSQTSAWSCNIAFPELMSMQLTITRNAPQLGKDGAYDVVLLSNSSNFPPPPDMNPLSYGASAPTIMPAMNMELVNDTFDMERGPAWFRMLPYNKTVLVDEQFLSASSSSVKRDGGGGIPPTVGNFQRKGVAMEGDRPWLCTWPDTFVEMFIYAKQNSSYAALSTATITTAPGPTSTATGTTATASSTGTTEVINMTHFSAYPRAIKVKERRVSQSPRPYCVQVLVRADNTTEPVVDESGNEVVIYIDEIEESNGMNKRDADLLPRGGDDGDMSDCGCMWFAS